MMGYAYKRSKSDSALSKIDRRTSLGEENENDESIRMHGPLKQTDGPKQRKLGRVVVRSALGTPAIVGPIRKRRFTLTAAANQIKNFLIPDYNKRRDEFKRLFKMSDDEKFIADYSCAFQREILVHGRMYISQNWLCFHANIFSWETTLTISLNDIKRITKKKTAKLFPNAVQVCTINGNKLFFTSLVSRTKTYHVLTKIWKMRLLNKDIEVTDLLHWIHNGFEHNEEQSQSEPEIFELSDRIPVITVDAMNDDVIDSSPPPSMMIGADLANHAITHKRRLGSRKVTTSGHHQMTTSLKASDEQLWSSRLSEQQEEEEEVDHFSDNSGKYSDNVFETVCSCKSHFGKELLYEVYPVSVNSLFQLLFTECAASAKFRSIRGMTDFEVLNQWKASNVKRRTKTRQISYTKQLNGFGPKSCRVIEQQEWTKRKDHVSVVCECHNEGIPYGDVFDISLTYCITRVSNHTCRLRCHGGVIFRKNSWGLLRGLVEKTSFTAMGQHYSDLRDHLRNECNAINDGKRTSMDLFQSCTSLYDALKHKASSELSKSSLNVVLKHSEYASLTKKLLAICFVLLFLNTWLYYFIWTNYNDQYSINEHHYKIRPK